MYNNFYSCDEHIDEVIDDFINLYNETPEIIFNNEFNEICCNYCSNYAKYLLLNMGN